MALLFLADPSSFRRSDLGTISGEFYLRVDDEFFPEERWNDLVLPVARAWLYAIQDLLRGSSRQERVRFMDGDFWADLAMSEEGGVAVDLVEGQLRGNLVRHSIHVDPADLLQAAVATATGVLQECRSRGWSGSDVEALARQLKEAGTGSVQDT